MARRARHKSQDQKIYCRKDISMDPKTLEPNEVVISLKYDLDRDVPGYDGALVCSIAVSDEGDNDALAVALDEAITLLAYHELGSEHIDLDEEIDLYKAAVLRRLFPDEYAEAEAREETPVEVSKDGNVYTLSFNSETEGSA